MKFLAAAALWLLISCGVFIATILVTDSVYFKLYYEKQTPEKQEQINEWLKNDSLFIPKF